MSASIDKQLCALQEQIEQVKARIALPAYANASGQQGQILGHFLSRALQASEAGDLVCRARLGTPLAALVRMLCEDLFLCFWASLSEKDAAEYSKAVTADSLRLVRVMLENERGKVRHTSTHEDKTDELLRLLKATKTDRVKIEQLVARLGLSRVYDLFYRYPSMEVHGKAFGLPSPNEEGGLLALLSAIVLLAKAIGLIADNRVLQNRTTTADEILRLLGMADIPGK
jgi:hypothetical protein